MNRWWLCIDPDAECHVVAALRPEPATDTGVRAPSGGIRRSAYNRRMSTTDRSDGGGTSTGRVFQRVLGGDLPVAVRAEGSTIWDADGRSYLDAAGGAIVVNVGHGRQSVAVSYTHLTLPTILRV